MQLLTEEKRRFFEDLLKYSKKKHNGYWIFQPRSKRFGNTKYKEHRILMQLHLNVLLYHYEIVHHKDGNKLNNLIDNLEVVSCEKHNSDHHAGSHKIGRFTPYNKLKKEIVNNIFELSKTILKKNGKPHFSKIAKELHICGHTVGKYLKKLR